MHLFFFKYEIHSAFVSVLNNATNSLESIICLSSSNSLKLSKDTSLAVTAFLIRMILEMENVLTHFN